MTQAHKPKSLWGNNTNLDLRMFYAVIAEACRNGGTLPEELADTFELVKTPAVAACEYMLNLLKGDAPAGR